MNLKEGKWVMLQTMICIMPNTETSSFMPVYVGGYFGSEVN